MNYPVYMDVTENRKIEIPLREVKRYLGYGKVEMTPEVSEIALKLVEEAQKILRPRACYTRLAVNFMDYPRMDFGFGIVESKNLWKNLSDGSLFDSTTPACTASSVPTEPGVSDFSEPTKPDVSDFSSPSESNVSDSSSPSESDVSDSSSPSESDVSDFSCPSESDVSDSSGLSSSDTSASYGELSSADISASSGKLSSGSTRECFLLAATIGPQMDVQIRKYARTSPSKGVILQAIGAAAIESYCDLLEERISCEVSAEGLKLLPRFSPGYGDFSLAHQRDFFRVLDPPRRAGITLTDQLLMVPEKSVTAVIGLAKGNAGTACQSGKKASMDKCSVCSNEGCSYRVG